jgi:hypothetical protein
LVLSAGQYGSAWADDADLPRAAQIVVGDFAFLAGEPNETLAAHIPADFAARRCLSFLVMHAGRS